ncbi:MAG: hypothetical protein WCD79_14795 [Chthoniobacteraceae bacterium]
MALLGFAAQKQVWNWVFVVKIGFELALNGFVLALFFWGLQSKNWLCLAKTYVFEEGGSTAKDAERVEGFGHTRPHI